MLLEQKVHLSRRPQRFVIAVECGKEPILIESREENQITVGRPLVLHAVEIEENICRGARGVEVCPVSLGVNLTVEVTDGVRGEECSHIEADRLHISRVALAPRAVVPHSREVPLRESDAEVHLSPIRIIAPTADQVHTIGYLPARRFLRLHQLRHLSREISAGAQLVVPLHRHRTTAEERRGSRRGMESEEGGLLESDLCIDSSLPVTRGGDDGPKGEVREVPRHRDEALQLRSPDATSKAGRESPDAIRSPAGEGEIQLAAELALRQLQHQLLYPKPLPILRHQTG